MTVIVRHPCIRLDVYKRQAYDLIFIENDLICFRTNGRAGFADREGRVIMEGSYHHVFPISGRNLAIVESNGQWGVVDLSLIHILTADALIEENMEAFLELAK